MNDVESIASLSKALSKPWKASNGDGVHTLLILGGNPAYNAPSELRFHKKIPNAIKTIHLSTHENETTKFCNVKIPRAHFLETWGDARSYDGTISMVQPIIEPLYPDAKSVIEVLAAVVGKTSNKVVTLPNGEMRKLPLAEALVRNSFAAKNSGKFDGMAWQQALHQGFVAGSAYKAITPALKALPEDTMALTSRQKSKGLGKKPEVVFVSSPQTYDGRFANNAWLQETPDPITKITWDNAALMSPATAKKFKVINGELIKLRVPGAKKSIKIPVWVTPGQAADSIALALGFGRTEGGHVAGLGPQVDSVGVNVYKLRISKTMTIAEGRVAVTGRMYGIASTQDHWAIDSLGREGIDKRLNDLIRSSSFEAYSKDASVAMMSAHAVPQKELFKLQLWDSPVNYQQKGKFRWGAVVDLNKCTNCNSCLVACQAENNVPVVGKEQVANNREMSWIRIDRYYKGLDTENPEIDVQPLFCQQCDNAPCEQVCPVGATVHSDEGLNDMVYNRCIGTRFCLNNCAYRVRRFNFLNYYKDLDDKKNKVRKLLYNPEVTVRSRGVMEKCTYCVQRIQAAKITLRNENIGGEEKPLKDGAVQTACQQACSTGALVFGDLNDPESRVAKLQYGAETPQKSPDQNFAPRAYALLGHLNTRPRTIYLGRVRNYRPDSSLGRAAMETFNAKLAATQNHSAGGAEESGDQEGAPKAK
jgi:molybdopterin-containing oxidoreductase family iron-sulfur binding subunit